MSLLLPCTLLASCCHENSCPAFDPAERSNWLPDTADSILVFEISGDPSVITFAVSATEATAAYTEPSRNSGVGCYVKDCAARASARYQTLDTQVLGGYGYTLSIRSDFMQTEEYRRSLYYRLGDFQGSFDTYPLLNMPHTEAGPAMERDSILSNLTLGGRSYRNVIVQTRNPADTGSGQHHIQKAYLAPGYGLVGFVRKGRLYYRQ